MSEGSTITAAELLRDIGPKLKAAREAKSLTLQEISSRTHINSVFLEQIENGRTDNLPGLTFVRGFIRNYLQVLDLQDEEIESALKQFSGLEQYKAETELGPRINEMHGNDDAAEVPFRKNLMLAALVIAVVLAGYLGVRVLSQPGGNSPAAVLHEARQRSDEFPPPGEQTAGAPAADVAPAAPTGADNPQSKGLPVGSPQNLRLTVRGLEPTWIRLSIDRAPPVEVRIAPAETKNWEANEEFRLIIGKSHGVAVYLNGEDILLPAARNQLIPDVVLNKLTLLRLEN